MKSKSNKGIVVLSVFDGMSCGQIALKRAGIAVKTYYASEINPYAIKATMHNFPSTIQLGSITDVHAKDLPKIDLFIGGSPCQGFSRAGKGLNFDDPRSQLFFEYVRLWNEIKAINPNAKFLLENVRMLKEWENIISKYMGINPVMINSSLVSAQNRERLYWNNFNLVKYGLFDCVKNEIAQPKDRKIYLKDILESEVDEKYFLSEMALKRIMRKQYSDPKINPDKTGTLNAKNNSGQLSVDSGTTLIQSRNRLKETLRGTSDKALSLGNACGRIGGNGCSIIIHNTQPRSSDPKKGGTGHLSRTDGKTYCLDTGNTNAVEVKETSYSKKNMPQGYRVNSVNDKSTTLATASGGLGWCTGLHEVPQPKSYYEKNYRDNNEKGNSLQATSYKGNQANGMTLINSKTHSRIRRLTPVECCRLQTVPDTYFWDEHGKNIISDSRIYECLGNGWTVDVIVHLLNFYKQHLNL